MLARRGRPRLPCRYFNTPRGCFRGDECTFLHDPKTATVNTQAQPFVLDDLQKWIRTVPRDSRMGEPLGSVRLAEFFKKALELVKQNSHNAQAVVTRLVTNGGLQCIDEVCDNMQRTSVNSFESQLLPFLQILCEDQVRDSFVLETSLGTIYNFLYGPNGRRALAVYTYAVKEFPKTTPALAASTLNILAITFANVVELNSSAALLEELKDVCHALLGFLKNLDDHHFMLHPAMAAMEKTAKRFAIAADFPHLGSATSTKLKGNGQPTFKLARDGPGSLSEEGPRHDNDFTDITMIKIMPTASEVMSSRQEYLPVLDLSQSHLDGVKALLDRQFRLLREDTVGQLRDAAKSIFDSEADKSRAARTLIYVNATVVNMIFDKFRGMDLLCMFDHPKEVRGMGVDRKRKWWQDSKRLQRGALVCLLGPQTTPIFCSVQETGLEDEQSGPHHQDKPKKLDYTLFNDPNKAYLTVTLVDTTLESVRTMFKEIVNGHDRGAESLVEFPGILIPSFKPTLEALQRMIKRPDSVPFATLIAPLVTGRGVMTIEPPVYARRPGFRFDLRCLAQDGHDLWLNVLPDYNNDQEQILLDRTTLDAGQARSLQKALTQELALIQGPPGTGKTYLGVSIIQALLANRLQADLGPIVCVCYTNHALDQLLEHLIDKGVKQIIRVGSRSKSEALEKLTLAHVGRQIDRSRVENGMHYQYKTELEQCVEYLKGLLQDFFNAESLISLKGYLLEHEPNHYATLFREKVDADGFITVTYDSKDPIRNWLSGRGQQKHLNPEKAVRQTHELRCAPLESMSPRERRKTYHYWIRQIRLLLQSKIEAEVNNYIQAKENYELIKKETDLRCLKQAHVIGVTTSGLARVVNLLSRVNAKVLICEEAGEVLEAHMLSTFLPSIQHAIFIGDQQQLRPQVQNYDLTMESPRGKQYSFDLSLFERLIDGAASGGIELPYSTLELQRRMHPSISELLRITSYPTLCDDESVEDYPEVVGMRKRLFWLDHSHLEAAASKDVIMATSHSNNYEVEMIAALVTHLVSQGVYSSQDIAVLTPYLGQVRKIKTRLAKSFLFTVNEKDQAELDIAGEVQERGALQVSNVQLLKGIRLATVDNFQGEEAKVVIISLVRCNEEKKCGFLKTDNRVNVLLSRAMHGMYMIGNKATYEQVGIWSQVIEELQRNGNIGPDIELACPRHPNTPIAAKTPDDFSILSPEGGCNLKCTKRLQCGHACYQKCHSELLHNSVKCLEPCLRTLKGCNDHPCPRTCGDACPPRCTVPIPNVLLPCGHIKTLPCWESKSPADAKCREEVEYTSEGCGHNITIDCYQLKHPSSIDCSAVCKEPMQCGHDCKQACHDCRTIDKETGKVNIDHGTCLQVCNRPFQLCQHSCQAPCHSGVKCSLCTMPCEVRCAHSACSKLCSEPCTPCAEEQCSSQCPHQRCEMPCAVPCNWKPCSLRCELELECGHQCPGLCGEICPSMKYCQECATEDILATEVDFIINLTYGEVDLNEDPCIFLQCGHFLTRSSMDRTVGMSDHYHMDEDGCVESIEQSIEPFDAKNLKTCPYCRGTLRNICRYGRIVKRALLDESTKRFMTWAQKQYTDLARQVFEAEERLSLLKLEKPFAGHLQLRGTRKDQFMAVKGIAPFRSGETRGALDIQGKIEIFLHKVVGEEQPYRQVWTMVENIRRRKGISAKDMPGEMTMVEMRFQTFAHQLLLKLDLALLSAAIRIKSEGLAKSQEAVERSAEDFIVDFSANRQSCSVLIDMAKESKYPRQQTEGHLLSAQYCCLERSVARISEGSRPRDMWIRENGSGARSPSAGDLKEEAGLHLKEAEALCEKYSGQTKGLLNEIDSTSKMLGETFFEPVTSEERMQVVQAMATELLGATQWYHCANGHPFAVGHCGLPTQLARCPECGAPVGGQSHAPARGVQADEEMNGFMSNLMRRMRLN